MTAANTTQPTHALEVRRYVAVSVDRSGADAGGISDVLILDSSIASRSRRPGQDRLVLTSTAAMDAMSGCGLVASSATDEVAAIRGRDGPVHPRQRR
jgi:hypothetical protein